MSCSRRQRKEEPLIPVEVPQFLFQVIGLDFFHHGGTDYSLVVDYLSKRSLVHRMTSTSSQAVIQKLKDSFALFGILFGIGIFGIDVMDCFLKLSLWI